MSRAAEPAEEVTLWDRERDALEDWLDSDDDVKRVLAGVLRDQAEGSL